MTTVTLDYSEMTFVAGKLAAKEQEMARSLSRIKAIADALVASDFKTVQASPAFDAAVATIVQNMAKSITAVGGYAGFLRTAAESYRKTDQALADQLGGGGATSTLKLDMSEIAALKSNLKTTQSAFNGVHDVAGALNSDVLGHGGLADAVHDFAHDWEKRRQQILKNVDDLYDAITAVNDGFTEVDTNLNQSLQGEGK